MGNRNTYTTTMTTTEVTTYQYDAANRLLQSVIQGGDMTTYDWDNASRLITTTVASAVSRVYSYSQDGDLLSALVDGQTTTFLYDGNGNRLQMTVGSEVTTYTLDYGRGFQLLMEQGVAFATVKHYLYGLECIGELIDADIPASKEWRYYQRDGNSLVRQTTNEQENITMAWTFSPEGAVVLGEEGPVTRLDCGSNAVYDWSTGLIFKNGRYFDPNTGIWLTLGGIVIWQKGWKRRFSRYGSKKKKGLLLLLYGFIALSLIGCGSNPTPTPCPTNTPIPGLLTGIPYGGDDTVDIPLIPPIVFPSPTPKLPNEYGITVNIVQLNGASRNWQADVDYADRVLDQADVSVNAVWKERLSQSETESILGNDNQLFLNLQNPALITSEELKLIYGVDNYNNWKPDGLEISTDPKPTIPRYTDGRITVYYVPSITASVPGRAFLPSNGDPASIAINPISLKRTLAHEFGHILLDDSDHGYLPNNFMAQTSVATGSDIILPEQVLKIQQILQANPDFSN